jgi:phospholipase/lecithinase/hemolysin
MKALFCKRIARLARSLWHLPAARAATRPGFRPGLESLEERSLLSGTGLRAAVPPPQFDHLYGFGESMSDNGTFFKVTGQPVAPYDNGRFTNGPVWVEYLQHDLGLRADQFTDLAVSGAGSGFSNVYISDPASPLYSSGLLSQVNSFTASHRSVDPSALYTVWAGINDYARNPSDPNTVVGNISTAVNELAAAGARYILVANLPDLGTLPGIRNLGPRTPLLSALSTEHDAALSTALGTLSQQWSGVHIMPLDVHALYNQMMTSPGTYGFTDVTDSAVGNTVYIHEPPSPTSDIWKTNPSALMFWDSIHPTTAGHQVIADYALSVLDHDLGVPSTLTVSNLNDGGIGSLRYELALAQDGATIVFAPGLHGTITLTSGELQVGQNVTIQGPGADSLAISGNHASRVFEILPGATVTMSGLTVTGGVANPAGSPVLISAGGGIAVDRGATLTLTNANVVGNVANAASAVNDSSTSVLGTGGGIYNAGTLTVIADLIRFNTANAGSALVGDGGAVDGSGGGIYNAGTLTVTDSLIAGNTANTGASSFLSGGEGGGIYTSGALTLARTMVASNTANAGPVTATVFGASDGTGGGLFIADGTATVTGSVFADDTANAASVRAADPRYGSAEVVGQGGGIANDAQVTVTATIFSGDVANAASGFASSDVEVSGYGGGLENDFAKMTATGVTLFDNTANAGSAMSSASTPALFLGFATARALGFGGGIYAGGTLTVSDNDVIGNTANSGTSAWAIHAEGGGIYDFDALTLTDSLVIANVANSASGASQLNATGGGISAAGGAVTGSLVAFNVVNSGSGIGLVYLSGGGIHDTGTLTVANSVLAFNHVNTDPNSGQAFSPNPSSAVGGGIDVDGGTLTLNHCSVAGNFTLGKPSDISTSNGGQVDPASANNLIGTGGSGGLVNGVNGNVVL